MSTTMAPAPGATTRFCTFTVDGFFFGVDIAEVREVLRYFEITPVPGAPRAIAGLINIRGEIVPALEMRRRLRRPERPAGSVPYNVVVATAEGPTSLLVDAIGDVVDVAAESFQTPPETLTGPGRQLITGACPLEQALLMRLDVARTVCVERDDD